MMRLALATSLCVVAALNAEAQQAFEVPGDTVLHVRLRQMVSSYGSKRGQRVTVEVIAPVEVDGRILLPLGARIHGYVEGTRRVGLGFSREVPQVDLSFDTLARPDADHLPITAMVAEVDNSRNTVDEKGRIRGIRASGTISSMLMRTAISVGFADPMLLGFTLSSSLSAFRMPESEIILPPGTESGPRRRRRTPGSDSRPTAARSFT